MRQITITIRNNIYYNEDTQKVSMEFWMKGRQIHEEASFETDDEYILCGRAQAIYMIIEGMIKLPLGRMCRLYIGKRRKRE